ncbi:hypothetical protein [Peribacillus cavernae]|uniref:hypothetical protein n=1 Tax=Peribacillus cavernae TaxID=1674310 RepID=UPI0027D83825|nr:hypothetical protein [Peribacillus cavernae]
MPTSPQDGALLVGLEVISQSSDGEKTAPHQMIGLCLSDLHRTRNASSALHRTKESDSFSRMC